MVIFSVYEDMFSDLYKWLMETFKPNMEGFSEEEGEPSFGIDFRQTKITFNRDNCSLPYSLRYQTLTTNVKLGLQVDTGLITITTPERKIYSKTLEIYKQYLKL